MSALVIPNRPFATERITGLTLPDGIFESSLGQQRINIHLRNTGAATVGALSVYIESASHPAIQVVPATHNLPGLAAGSSRVMAWEVDFSLVPPGEHRVSFIAMAGGQKTRIIKKIFVTRVTYDPATATFTAQTPEGTLSTTFGDFIGPEGVCCGKGRERATGQGRTDRSFLDWLRTSVAEDPNFRFCIRRYLPTSFDATVTPPQPWPGQYGDLPFQDPWWKVVLAIVAALLLIGAAIAEELDGSGSVSPGAGGTFEETTGEVDCCSVQASGGGTSPIAAGLVAAAAAVATIAAASDARDPFRRGQDQTNPAEGELTTGERVVFAFDYKEPVALGRPFAIGAKWSYTRFTTGDTYTFSATDTQVNTHVLSRVEIEAPDVAYQYQRIPWVIHARFYDAEDRLLRGDDLFVQCFLLGPNGQRYTLLLQDDGNWVDEKASDGTYTGLEAFFLERHHASAGLWTYYVVAQDVNHAKEGMSPDAAAQHIGGMVVTHNLTITFEGGTCPFVPDGHVLVVA